MRNFVLLGLLSCLSGRAHATPVANSDQAFASALSGARTPLFQFHKASANQNASSIHPAIDPIQKAVDDLGTLPGQVSFQLQRLDPQPQVLYQKNPDVQLAIGSAFKLYILAALADGRPNWNEVLRIDDKYRSLPSGFMYRWPAGAPVTLYGLAAEMISRSDNTATDHLLHYIGRSRAEDMMRLAGNAHPERSTPFLSTMDMFRLKSDPTVRAKYLAADEAGRRRLLETDVQAISRDEVAAALSNWTTPTAIDSLEWFASAADINRLMDYLRRTNDQTVLRIMAINPGLVIDENVFPYAGFKGGSEPGVLSLNFLLKTRAGASYALSAVWNDPARDVDLKRFAALVQTVIDSLGASQSGNTGSTPRI